MSWLLSCIHGKKMRVSFFLTYPPLTSPPHQFFLLGIPSLMLAQWAPINDHKIRYNMTWDAVHNMHQYPDDKWRAVYIKKISARRHRLHCVKTHDWIHGVETSGSVEGIMANIYETPCWTKYRLAPKHAVVRLCGRQKFD